MNISGVFTRPEFFIRHYSHPLRRGLVSVLLLVFTSAWPDHFKNRRQAMVNDDIIVSGIKDTLVLDAMRKVPRHLFVPEELRDEAYADYPLQIGYGQTISQPYVVAYMTELLGLKGGEKVLEIGTGSGYQAAILSVIADSVYSIEIVCELEECAKKTLQTGGYSNVTTRCGDGYAGWAEQAPFDAVIITASPPEIPGPLVDQLKVGGVLVSPLGESRQHIVRWTKTEEGIKKEKLIGVLFVPMTGKAQEK